MNLLIKNTQRLRLVFLMFLSCLLFGAIIARLYYLQITRHEHYVYAADRQQHKKVKLSPRRGDILDRNGVILATSHDSDTIVFDTRKVFREQVERKRRKDRERDASGKLLPLPEPKILPTPEGLVQELADTLKLETDRVQMWFDKPERRIVYRNAPSTVSLRLQMLEQNYRMPEGMLIYEKTSKREYPKGPLASHVLGFTAPDDNGDNLGNAGVELQYNELIKGESRELSVPVGSGLRRASLEPIPDEAIAATYGQTLVLTIDQQIQNFAEATLRRHVGKWQAAGGVALVMDVRTGEMLAMANCPDFNPNQFSRASAAQRRNAALTDPIEPGSVMKIFTSALLLDNNLVGLDEIIDCKGGRATVGGRLLKDSHPMGAEPFTKCFAESSNIAFGMLGARLEPNLYYQGLLRCGFGARSGIDLPGEGTGILRDVNKWSGLMSRTSLAIGYEASLTPMQVISAVGGVGNGGMRMRPHLLREVRSPQGDLVKRIEPEMVDRICSPQTAASLLDLMGGVVTEGTGGKAKVPGYGTGGKTGTTRKSHLKDERRYIASFAGLIPIENPRVAIYVYIDEPQGAMYGGQIAGPIFSEIAASTMHVLGVPPDNREEWLAAQAVGHALEFDAETSATQLAGDPNSADPQAAAVSLEASPEQAMAAVAPSFETAIETAPIDDGGEVVRMPDFKGMTMIEAWDELARNNLQARMLGSGVLSSQTPPPGARISTNATATLVFTLPSQADGQQVSLK